jgi:serine/threonine protein kinase
MGEVFRARDTKLHREVAIKVLPAAVAHDPERRERFERESADDRRAESSEHRHDPRRRAPAARARRDSARRRARGERVGSPRAVKMRDHAFLAMEIVEGRPLYEVIPRGGMKR